MYNMSPGRLDRLEHRRFYSSAVKRWIFLSVFSVGLVLLSYGSFAGRIWRHTSHQVNAFAGEPASVSYEFARAEPSEDITGAELFTSNGLTDQVQWDNYSLVVKGQRIFL